MKLIILTGLPGARKSDIASMLTLYGNFKYNMSDIIKSELEKHNLDLIADNYKEMASHLRKEYGPQVIAQRTCIILKAHLEEFKIVDGLRSIAEYQYFLKEADFVKVILVHASKERRYTRIRRNSGNDLQSLDQLEQLDQHNFQLGIAEVMAYSDYVIPTGDYVGLDIEEMTKKVYFAILEEANKFHT